MAKVLRETLESRFRGELLSYRTYLLAVRGDLDRLRRGVEIVSRRVIRDSPGFIPVALKPPDGWSSSFDGIESEVNWQLDELERYLRRG